MIIGIITKHYKTKQNGGWLNYVHNCPYLACGFQGQGLPKHFMSHGQTRLETSCQLKIMKYLLPLPGQRTVLEGKKLIIYCCYLYFLENK